MDLDLTYGHYLNHTHYLCDKLPVYYMSETISRISCIWYSLFMNYHLAFTQTHICKHKASKEHEHLHQEGDSGKLKLLLKILVWNVKYWHRIPGLPAAFQFLIKIHLKKKSPDPFEKRKQQQGQTQLQGCPATGQRSTYVHLADCTLKPSVVHPILMSC